VFFISPLLYLFFGVRVYNASEWQVLGYAVPHIFGTIMVTDYLYGREAPVFSELYEAVQSMYLVPVILATLINPRPRFKVTPREEPGRRIPEPLAVPFYLLSLSLMGMMAPFSAGPPIRRKVLPS
jgi:cellulose synthase (UDP-forming)